MNVHYDLTPSAGESAVALGNFDGLHLGHREVISCAAAQKERGLIPTVLTFGANPLTDLGGTAGGEIITQEQKISLLEELGIEQIYILNFPSVKDLTPEEFVDRILTKVCRAKEVCCGFNFTFGRGGRAGSEMLEQLCAQRSIGTSVTGAVLVDGEPVSSTRIRGLISKGDVGGAARLLGRPFGYRSVVQHGRRLGRELGTPTLNQAIPQNFVVPLFGVYISKVLLDGHAYAGVTNVGVKPTVGSPCALAETWMPDYNGPDIYGRTVQVDFIQFLRPEMKFAGLEQLKTAILKDGEKARAYFKSDALLPASAPVHFSSGKKDLQTVPPML